METKAISKFIKLAHDTGIKKDQLERFLKYGYIPLPWQLKFHAAAREADEENGPVDVALGGARGPGKSHGAFAQAALDDCQRVSKLKVLFLRQTGKSAEESFQDLVDSVLANRVKYIYNSSKGILKFQNGSRMLLGGFDHEDDIDKYIGIQYDLIVIEERNQLTGIKVIKLKGSLRTVKPNWRARMYSSFNPGNIGHADIKKTFIVPFNQHKETVTRFIPATYKDNPFLKPEYIDYLNSLEGALGKAWREGNFDTFEGQYFQEWDISKHVIAPFEIPIGWKKFRAYDHGRENPACCKWYALDYDGRLWVYKELYVKGLNVDQIASEINRLSVVRDSNTGQLIPEQYEYSVADPSIFANTGFVDKSGGQTIAESFARYGIMFIKASNRRVDGWNLMHQYMHWGEAKMPKIIYFSNCIESIRTIPELIHDEIRPEDLDTDGEDHAADADRYILLTMHDRKSAVPKTEVQQKLEQIKRERAEVVEPSTLNKFYSGDYYRRHIGK